jgi:hypothetical protein
MSKKHEHKKHGQKIKNVLINIEINFHAYFANVIQNIFNYMVLSWEAMQPCQVISSLYREPLPLFAGTWETRP